MSSPGKYRWSVVTLLFFATTINYLDRQVIGLLKDYLAVDLHWSEQDYSRIVIAFTAAYATGLFLFGRIIDSIGTKVGYRIAVIIWSMAAAGHGFVRTTLGFGVMRTFLGLGEGGNFPAAIKAVAEWFPKKERALATGIFNSGTNIAAVIGPFVVMWIYTHYGWREAFLWTGMLGILWLVAWQVYYDAPETQKRLSRAELDLIRENETEKDIRQPKRTLRQLLTTRQTWAFAAAKFFSDPIWWFYLFWIPSYFNSTYHIDLKSSWVYVSTIYFVASFGSIAGGYFSGWLIRRGWPALQARKRVMLIYAFCVVPIIFIQLATQVWWAVALISLAAAAHQAWSANLFTTTTDMFPRRDVSSVVGIGGMMGSVGSVLFPYVIGLLLDHFKALDNLEGGYNIIFVICGCSYLVAWGMLHVILLKKNQEPIV
jgi:ACS family hexuronate transporter-like MFS transporter